MQVILFGYFPIAVLINQIKYPADKGILSAKQPQSSSKLFISHIARVVAKLIEPFGDSIYFLNGELEFVFVGLGLAIF